MALRAAKAEYPHSPEIEEAVLGGLIAGGRDTAAEVMGTRLSVDDFYLPANRQVYEAIQYVYNAGGQPDMLTVGARLQQLGQLETAGGADRLAHLSRGQWSFSMAKQYAGELRSRALQRATIRTAGEIVRAGFETSGAALAPLLREAAGKFLGLQDQYTPDGDDTSIEPLWSAAYDAIADMRAEDEHGVEQGIRSGLPPWDEVVDPLIPGDYAILAARPSQGKTMLAMQVATNVAHMGTPVLFYSAEMGTKALARRALAAESAVESDCLRSLDYRRDHGEQVYGHLMAALERMYGLPIYVTRPAVCSPASVASKALGCRQRYGLGLLVVDYLQLLTPSRGHTNDSYEVASAVTRELKTLATTLEVPLLCLSQLSRAVETRSHKQPVLSDLRDSGKVEEDADLVTFLYRPGYYPANDWAENQRNRLEPGDVASTKLIVAKQRNGVAGVERWMRMEPRMSRFEEGGGPGWVAAT